MSKKEKPWKAYTRGRTPIWIKAVLLKWWFGGAVLFFIGWGLQLTGADSLDLAILLGIVMGILTDLLINRVLKMMEKGRGECAPFIMWNQGGVASLFLNVLHGILISLLVSFLYGGINLALIALAGLPKTSVPFGVEPIFYGLFYLGFEMLFIWLKRGIVKNLPQRREP